MTMPHATPRFAADAMLGRLAKWLRLLGLDTTYDRAWDDRALLRHAAAEGRVLLTRDTRLLRRRGLPPHLFIEDDHFRDQLRQVLNRFALDPRTRLFARCSRCNTELEHPDPACAQGRVPPYVFASQRAFARCPSCGRLYWGATHAERIRAEVDALRRGG